MILDKYNIGKMVEQSLLDMLKDKVMDNIMDNIMDNVINEFKLKAEPEIKKEVEKLVISRASHLEDFARFRDEIRVYCEWDDGVSVKTFRGQDEIKVNI